MVGGSTHEGILESFFVCPLQSEDSVTPVPYRSSTSFSRYPDLSAVMADPELEILQVEERRPRFQVNRVEGKNGSKGSLVREGLHQEELEPLKAEDEEYVASYSKSFRHFTREALPRMDNYRNIMSIQAAVRPTLEELHNETEHVKVRIFLLK